MQSGPLPLGSGKFSPDPRRSRQEEAQHDQSCCQQRQNHDGGCQQEAGLILIQTIDIAQIESIENDAFGFSMPSLPALSSRSTRSKEKFERDDVNEITALVKSARIEAVTNRAIVVLENGQTWEQIDMTKLNAPCLRKAKEAKVHKAALGRFIMTIDGGRGFRVKRVS